MEREIRFRAWHKEMKYMSPVGILCFNNWAEIYIPEQTSPDGVVDWQGGQVKLSEIELMQFTGLLDKNGKEIYEGDIVEEILLYPTNERLYEVVFNQELFEFEMIKKYPSGCSTTWLHITERKSLEVVGNIYENPELLEVK